MRHYKLGAHTKTEFKVHLVWIPKYRKKVLTGNVAVRTRDILRQISMELELEIITGKVSKDHVHIIPSGPKHQQDHAITERDKPPDLPFRVSTEIFRECLACFLWFSKILVANNLEEGSIV